MFPQGPPKFKYPLFVTLLDYEGGQIDALGMGGTNTARTVEA